MAMRIAAPMGCEWRQFQDEGRKRFVFFQMHYWCRASLPSTCSMIGVMMTSMTFRPRFWRWVIGCGIIGLLVPAALSVKWFGFHSGAGSETVLWPSSIMFMALDVPSPATISTVAVVYTVAIIENILLYAVLGAVTWLLAHAVVRVVDRRAVRDMD